MRDCPNGEMRDLLPELLHERLTGEARSAVAAHVAECVDCADELALLRDLRGALSAAPSVDVRAIVRALPAPPAARPSLVPRRSAPSWGGWRAAAAVAAVVVGGASWALLSRDAGSTSVAAPRTAAVGAPAVPADSGAPSAAPSAAPAGLEGAAEQARGRGAEPAARPREVALAAPIAHASEATDAELEALLREIEAMDASLGGEPETPLPVATGPRGGR